MKKNLLIILSILTLIQYSCVNINKQLKTTKFDLIAEISNDEYVFKIDTIKLKSTLENKISIKDYRLSFDEIKIIKQNTLLSNNEFYYFILNDFKNHTKVAKWLTKIDDKLYSKDIIDSEDLFEQSYLVCVGLDDCSPQVFESDSLRQWGCSEDVICYSNEEEAQKQALKCKSYKMIIQN